MSAGRLRIPIHLRLWNLLARRLLGAGLSMGPGVLLTVPGRRSDLPRTTAVAVIEAGGQRWLTGTFGDVNWTRNLRAAGQGVIQVGAKRQPVQGVELSHEEATRLFREVLVPFVHRHRWALGAELASRLEPQRKRPRQRPSRSRS